MSHEDECGPQVSQLLHQEPQDGDYMLKKVFERRRDSLDVDAVSVRNHDVFLGVCVG